MFIQIQLMKFSIWAKVVLKIWEHFWIMQDSKFRLSLYYLNPLIFEMLFLCSCCWNSWIMTLEMHGMSRMENVRRSTSFFNFIGMRVVALENFSFACKGPSAKAVNTIVKKAPQSCISCKGEHALFQWANFKALDVKNWKEELVSKHSIYARCIALCYGILKCKYKYSCSIWNIEANDNNVRNDIILVSRGKGFPH